MRLNALDLCNCCEVEPASPTNRAGYCSSCEASAKAGEPCWHEGTP